MVRFGFVAMLFVGGAMQPSAVAVGARFPLITCATDLAAREQVIRVDCRQPREVLDSLQRQVDALQEFRADWDAEQLCGTQYRKAREWFENDRPSLLRYAQDLLNKCNQAGSRARSANSAAN